MIPSLGMDYRGDGRTAYLPNNVEGRAALRMLKRAFMRGLLFTVGKSITTGRDNTTVHINNWISYFLRFENWIISNLI